jgi:ATP-dependent DNA helicase RecG
VSYTTFRPPVSREAEVAALRRAIAVERRSYYANLQGKRTTFSRFMRQTAEKLARRYPMELVWATIRGLFRDYATLDVGTRISIVKRAEELLQPFWNHLNLATDSPDIADDSDLAEVPETSGLPIGDAGSGARSISVSSSASSSSSRAGHPSTSSSGALRNTPQSADGHARSDADRQSGSHAVKQANLAAGAARAGSNPGAVNCAKGAPDDRSTRSKSVQPASAAEKSTKAPGADAIKAQSFSDVAEIPVRLVKGVGPKAEDILNRLGINTVADLIRHYPRRHLDFQNRLFIRQLKPGMEVTIFGTIRSIGAFQSKRGNISVLNIVISDETGSILITRFVGGKSNKYLLERYKSQYPKGSQVLASGVVERDQFSNRICLKNAEIEIIAQGGGVDVQGAEGLADDSLHLHTNRLVPVYPLTDGIGLRHLRNIIFQALQSYGHLLKDALPDAHRERLQLMPVTTAAKAIHFPSDLEENEAARRRLVFDELFSIQLHLACRRHRHESTETALSLVQTENSLVGRLLRTLPFKLTGAQERVFAEIAKDLESPKPMHRLVQGDVGSGKTIVALLAFMVAIDNGFQCAMMAPTEILAEQHFRQFQKLVTPLGLKTGLVIGKQGQKERRSVRQDLLSGQIHIAVGTHALLTDDVEFKNLGLIIIDEQHRFGVKQRAKLKLKSQSPELLTMTATPIPRTMALTIHGDLDVSEIDELPPGRKPIETLLYRQAQRKQIRAAIEDQLTRGRQVYIVFPLIDESETLSAKAATKEYERLRSEDFQHRRVGLMHGKLSAQEKDEVMDKFRSHEFDILVCTTVVEVGVDVPNATVMVIENADRFGLAQLHQLRGRVGRGCEQSYCYLVSDSQAEATLSRLNIMTETNDGFVIAEKDLELRGPGEFLGYRQSGLPDLVLADLVKDAKILEDARNTAIAIVKEDPGLKAFPALEALLKRMKLSVETEIVRSG